MNGDMNAMKEIRAGQMNRPYPAQVKADKHAEIQRRSELRYRASIEAEGILEHLTADGKDLVMLALFNGLKAKFEPKDGVPKNPLDQLWLQLEQVGLKETSGATTELLEKSDYSGDQVSKAKFLATKALFKEFNPPTGT